MCLCMHVYFVCMSECVCIFMEHGNILITHQHSWIRSRVHSLRLFTFRFWSLHLHTKPCMCAPKNNSPFVSSRPQTKHAYVRMYTCICACIYVCACAFMCICLHVRMHVGIRVCVRTCVCMCAYNVSYIHTCWFIYTDMLTDRLYISCCSRSISLQALVSRTRSPTLLRDTGGHALSLTYMHTCIHTYVDLHIAHTMHMYTC